MTMLEFLATQLQPGLSAQVLPESIVNIRAVKRKGSSPAHSKVEFLTLHMTPADMMFFTDSRQQRAHAPDKIGIVVWCSYADYVAATENHGEEARDE